MFQSTHSTQPQPEQPKEAKDSGQLDLFLSTDYRSTPQSPEPRSVVKEVSPTYLFPFSHKTWGVVGLTVLLSGLAIAGLYRGALVPVSSQTAIATQVNALGNALDVDVIEIEPVDSFVVSRRYAGEVVAERTSELGFERSGELVWLGVDRGDRVEVGQILARLDTRQLQAQRSQLVAQRDQAQALLRELETGPRTEEIDAAQSRVEELDDQLQLARIQQTRREYLHEEGAISRDQLDEVAFGAEALQDRLATAQSQLDELLAGTRVEQIDAQRSVVRQLIARLEDIDIAIEKGSLIAPFSGVIADRRMDEGTVVDGGQSVMRLVERSRPEIEIGIPVDALAGVGMGSNQQVSVGGKSYQATVLAILPEVDDVTRTRQVVLGIDSTDHSGIAPGQIAELAIAQPNSEQGYWVPTSALVSGDRGLWAFYVIVEAQVGTDLPEFIASETNAAGGIYQVQRRDVEILHTDGERSFVRGMVQAGDRVVTDGTQRLVPGQLVRVNNA